MKEIRDWVYWKEMCISAEKERDEAIAECRRRKGWEQDIAHWRERAEALEAMVGRLVENDTTLRKALNVYTDGANWQNSPLVYHPVWVGPSSPWTIGIAALFEEGDDLGVEARALLNQKEANNSEKTA